jgi:ribosome-associated toxin RatA of RatAB toxin-antitoxin module|tara:strand:+ start:1432 stop:1884 length:453 start_codon:yes stop_codon:yes gene_type:complete
MELEFSMILPAFPEQFIRLSSDYESLPKFLPGQLKSVKIIEHNSDQIITEEVLVFSTIIRNELRQKTLHHNIDNNEMISEIISGHAKGTVITVKFKKHTDGTDISVNIKLNLSLKARILSPFIKKWYKRVLTGIFYRMNSLALDGDTYHG